MMFSWLNTGVVFSLFLCQNLSVKEVNPMNDIERRFYSEPEIRNIPIGHLSTMKDIIQKILRDILKENPYATIEDILSEPTDKYIENVDEF